MKLITLPDGRLQAYDTETTIRITFEPGRFNDTKEVTSDFQPLDRLDVSRTINKLVQWIIDNHPETLGPELNDDDLTPGEQTRKYIGKMIHDSRISQGISMRELAAMAGLSKNHVLRIEQARYNYTIDSLAAITAALGLRIKLG